MCKEAFTPILNEEYGWSHIIKFNMGLVIWVFKGLYCLFPLEAQQIYEALIYLHKVMLSPLAQNGR